MDIENFKNKIKSDSKPDALPLPIQALWHDGKGDWKTAHDLIDHLQDSQSAHVHAYLHRKEGDLWNADYWYAKAGQKRPNISLDEEWEQLVLKIHTS